jgi:hypothetical protein
LTRKTLEAEGVESALRDMERGIEAARKQLKFEEDD